MRITVKDLPIRSTYTSSPSSSTGPTRRFLISAKLSLPCSLDEVLITVRNQTGVRSAALRVVGAVLAETRSGGGHAGGAGAGGWATGGGTIRKGSTVWLSGTREDGRGRPTVELRESVRVWYQTHDGSRKALDVVASDRVRTVKRMIESAEGDRRPQQSLCLDGERLNEARQLSSYVLGPDSVLRFAEMQIFVRGVRGTHLALFVLPSDTVDDLKERVCAREGVPVDEQCFLFAGKRLAGELTFADYNIQREATLQLAVRLRGCREVHVRRDSMDLDLTVAFEPDDSVLYLKQKLAESVGLAAASQKLILHGRELEDGRELRSYDFEGAVVRVRTRVPSSPKAQK